MPRKKRSSLPFKVSTSDCIALLSGLKARSVDLVLADPPFNIGYSAYDSIDDKRPDYVEWCTEWMDQVYRVVKNDGSFWLYIGDEYVSELDVAAKSLGFYKRSHVVHYYTFGVACQTNFSRSHTHFLYFTKRKTKPQFNPRAIRVPSQRQLVYNDKRAKRGGKMPDNTWILTRDELRKCFGKDHDTWLESRVCGTFHERQDRGTYGSTKAVPQMPEALVDRVLAACLVRKPSLVVDPFLGNGTTGVCAVRAGHRFIGGDISSEYVKRARARIRAAITR